MKTRIFLLGAGVLMGLSVQGSPLTPGEALQRARSNGSMKVSARVAPAAMPAYTAKMESGAASAYVFNGEGGGYVIVSADDVAYPVLGYSDNGSIDADNLSPELKWWLEEYGRQIEWAVSKGAKEAVHAPQAREGWAAIAPQLTTKWDQDSPYNDMCPVSNSITCVTGCVATAMAQVMNYHKYPQVGEGIKKYYCNGIRRNLILNFAQKEFDWDNMLNSYVSGGYNETQAEAVAYLMKACGYSVEMNYTTDMSGASGNVIGDALRTYFKYDGNCRTYLRFIYSNSEWNSMIYENLKNVGPVVMNGHSPQGGHSFVCDGYDGNGYFHFNWGWSGMSDGYYSLDALNPDAQGIGGYAGGFNSGQNAILGIQPPTGLPVEAQPDRVIQYGNTTASLSGNTLNFHAENYSTLGWANGGEHDITVFIGAIIEPIEGTSGSAIYQQGRLGTLTELTLPSNGSYYPQTNTLYPSVVLPALPDGTYKVTLASRSSKDDSASWYPVLVGWGYNNYVKLKVSGGNMTVENVPLASLSITDLELLTDLYSGKYFKMKAKFANNSDIELSQTISPQALKADGTTLFTGETTLISVMPGETIEKEWVSKFYNASGQTATVTEATDVKIAIYNEVAGIYYPGAEVSATIEPISNTLTVNFGGDGIVDCDREVISTDNGNVTAIVVPDINSFDYYFTLNVSRGFFDGEVRVSLYKQDPAHPQTLIAVEDQLYSDRLFLKSGSTEKIDIPVKISGGEYGVMYYITVSYTYRSQLKQLARTAIYQKDPLAVDSISTDNDENAEYYDMQGFRIEEPVDGQMVIVRKSGKVTKQIWHAR